MFSSTSTSSAPEISPWLTTIHAAATAASATSACLDGSAAPVIPQAEVPAVPVIADAMYPEVSTTVPSAAPVTPPRPCRFCDCVVSFDPLTNTDSTNLPEVIEDAVMDASRYASQARTDSEMSKACWIMILQACRDMRAVVSAFVPAEHMPPPVLPTFGRLPHGSAPDPPVPIAVDGPDDRVPSDPLYPPALQTAADVTQAVHTVRRITRNHVRNLIERTVHTPSLIAAIRRQG